MVSLGALTVLCLVQELSTIRVRHSKSAVLAPSTQPCHRTEKSAWPSPTAGHIPVSILIFAWCIPGYGYITRRADSEGVSLGALSLPWACAGLILMGWRYAVDTGLSLSALLMRITVFWTSRRNDAGNVPPRQKLSNLRAGSCSWVHVTMTWMEECCDCAEYAEIAQQASTAGSMAKAASFAGYVAALVTGHSGQPAVSSDALVGPAQTTVPGTFRWQYSMQLRR